MVVGNGLIAKGFQNYKEVESVVIFASGVSNSNEEDGDAYLREKNLVLKTIHDSGSKLFVYFSTCSVYDKYTEENRYVQHKIEMESLVKELEYYYIFRLPQVVGVSHNKYQLFNFLVNSINESKKFNLYKNAFRNFIDIDDIFKIVDKIIKRRIYLNSTINIANKHNIAICEAVEKIEEHFSKKANYNLIDKGNQYDIDIEPISDVIKSLGIEFDCNYFERLLTKYKRV